VLCQRGCHGSPFATRFGSVEMEKYVEVFRAHMLRIKDTASREGVDIVEKLMPLDKDLSLPARITNPETVKEKYPICDDPDHLIIIIMLLLNHELEGDFIILPISVPILTRLDPL
jgi:hypothetical protein